MKVFFAIIALFLCSCQSGFLIKPHNFKKHVHKVYNNKLIAVDRSKKSLESLYKNKKGLVLLFWQNGCPCVQRYQKRINELFEKYSKKDIGFVYISSNTNESFQEVIKEYNERDVRPPIMRDEDGELAKILKVKTTPSAVLLDNKGTMRFIGWIDNERQPGEHGRIAYLENALKDFLKHDSIKNPTARMFGCAIR